MNLKTRIRIISILIGFLSISILSIGDIITFNEGRHLQGRILNETDELISFELLGGGQITIKKDSVVNIDRENEKDFYEKSGDRLLNEGDFDRALQMFLKAQNINSLDSELDKKIDAAKYMERINSCQKAINLADELAASKRHHEAIDEYRKALPLAPTDDIAKNITKKISQTHADLAYSYYDHCYYEGAMRELQKAEELDSDCGKIYFIRGKIYFDIGAYQKARAELEKALKLEPDNVEYKKYFHRTVEDFSVRTTKEENE